MPSRRCGKEVREWGRDSEQSGFIPKRNEKSLRWLTGKERELRQTDRHDQTRERRLFWLLSGKSLGGKQHLVVETKVRRLLQSFCKETVHIELGHPQVSRRCQVMGLSWVSVNSCYTEQDEQRGLVSPLVIKDVRDAIRWRLLCPKKDRLQKWPYKLTTSISRSC